MTGIVLALASLTAGDGGPGMGAAIAPVTPSLDGDLEERWEGGGRAELRHGALKLYGPRENVLLTYSMRIDGEGTVRVTDWQGRSWKGIYRLAGRHLLICWNLSPDRPSPVRPQTGYGQWLIRLRPAPLGKR
jgi:hypothetical protein